jgi:phage gpG-like protein
LGARKEAGLAERTLEQFARDVNKASRTDLRKKILKLLKALETKGQTYARDNYGVNGLRAPTGALRNSIKFNALTSGRTLGVEGTAGMFGARVVYAAVHEYGYPERNIPARPYISPAMEYLKREMGPELKGLFRSSVLGRRWTP